MKKNFRNININNTDFIYWYKAKYDNGFNIKSNTIIISPKVNKNNRIHIKFELKESFEKIYLSNILNPSSLEPIHLNSEAETKNQKLPTIYYDTENLYSAEVLKEGVKVILDFGKPKLISELILYLFKTKQIDITKKNIFEFDGWEILKQIGYSNFKPIISYSF